MPSQSAPFIDKICETPDCGKKVCSRGFCVACYYRKLRRGEIKVGTQTKRKRHRLSNLNLTNKTAICAQCGEVKITKRSANSWRCSTDVNIRSRDYKRAYRQSKKEQLIDHCEICFKETNLCWDHNHSTGLFRGTLCIDCNLAIGLLKDNPVFCINASNYLISKNEKSSAL